MISADVSAILRGDAATASAAELREMRDSLSVANAEQRVFELTEARRKALIDGSDDEAVDRVEKDLERANREVERTAAAEAELDRRIAAAEQVEMAARLDARVAEAKKRCRAMGEDYAALGKNLDEAARAIARIHAGEAFIRQTNELLKEHNYGHRALVQSPTMLHSTKFGSVLPDGRPRPGLPPSLLINGVIQLDGSPDGYKHIKAFDEVAEVCRDV